MLAASSSVLAGVFAPLPTYDDPKPSWTPSGPAADTTDLSRFQVDQTLKLEARLGRASVAKGSDGSTFLFASVTGAEGTSSAPPLNLAIVIDKSGSMKGERIARAIDAGVGVVERMRDGDTITVVDFDTASEIVVAPTRLTSSSRPSVEAAIRGIRLGGDTCISCGIETAAAQLRAAPLFGDHVTRMIVLSDGATNHGVTDLPGLRSIAGRMRDRGCSITTIGVDVDFDEKVMAALAQESNGRHYFVASAAGLPAIFSQEFDSLVASVAQDADLAIDLAPGVEVEQVFDRTFRRENAAGGDRIVIPFGVFSAKQQKTALVKLRVPTDHDGTTPVARMSLTYRDLVARSDRHEDGSVALLVKTDGSEQREIDPFVGDRVERSRTAETLTKANELFESGHLAEAQATLATRETDLHRSPVRLAANGLGGGGAALDKDLDQQLGAVAEAEKNMAPMATTVAGAAPAPAHAHAAAVQVRKNAQAATDLAF
jgi:Ca-activated chloride channel family protein